MESNIAFNILLASSLILLLAFLLAFVRLLKGPTMNDRIASLDLIASIIMGFVLVYAVLAENTVYFDLAIIIALISFIGTVAVSTYLNQKQQ